LEAVYSGLKVAGVFLVAERHDPNGGDTAGCLTATGNMLL